jgi:hypothetical protein
LLVVHPEIAAVRTANAILDGAFVALEHPIDPRIDARNVVRVHAIAPKIRIVEIFPRGAAE